MAAFPDYGTLERNMNTSQAAPLATLMSDREGALLIFDHLFTRSNRPILRSSSRTSTSRPGAMREPNGTDTFQVSQPDGNDCGMTVLSKLEYTRPVGE